jgi:hypothetical protein
MNGALLDTSFLITLASAARANHSMAVRYFRAFIEHGVPMYLSTIVISEFEVRQRIRDLGLNNFIVVPFNIDHAIAAASLTDSGLQHRADGQGRATVKDDVKLIAQCELGGISHFFTDDGRCCAWLENMRRAHSNRKLPFGVDLDSGFSSGWFNPSNQGGLLPEGE